MTPITRRTALALAAGATLAFPARAQAKPVGVALDWTPNTNHVGLFVAREKGFYRDAGLSVDILPYGDTPAGTLVANGLADFGVMGTVSLSTQRASGADLVAVFAITRKETGRVVFQAARSEIRTPKDLDGLTYGGFGSAWENALLGSIIRNAGGRGEFETVTLGTSAYEALRGGSVDFTLEVSTWEGVEAALAGERQRSFRYADYGVPDEHTAILGSSRAFLDANRETATAFLRATRRGYAFAADRPDEAADILLAANAATLTNPALVRASMRALVDGGYLRGADGTVGRIDPAVTEAMIRYLHGAAILRDADGAPLKAAPDAAAFWSNDYLPAD